MQPETRLSERAQLNMAPLIDVVLLLLIFFLLTSSHATVKHLEMRLPESSTATTTEDESLTVVVNADTSVTLGGEIYTPVTLVAEVARRLKGDRARSVVIEADAIAELQDVLRVMDAIREAGGRNVALATRPQP